MNDVKLNVTGLDLKFTGAQITYAANQIPVALLSVDPTQGELLNIKNNRRNKVTIDIKTPTGSTTFTGFFDDMSIVHSVGGIRYSAVIKGVHQSLLETYPMYPGYHPGSEDIWHRTSTVNVDTTQAKAVFLSTKINNADIEGDQSIIDFVVSFLKEAIGAQISYEYVRPEGILEANELYETVFKNKNYLKNLEFAKELLDNIDASAVKNTALKANTVTASNTVFNILASGYGSTSIWDILVRTVTSLGCVVIPGNSKTYIIPDNAYYDMGDQINSGNPNIFKPTMYNTFTFNGNGYVDVGAVFLLTELAYAQGQTTPPGTAALGSFIDDTQPQASVYVERIPGWMTSLRDSLVLNTKNKKSTPVPVKIPDLKPVDKNVETVTTAAKDANSKLQISFFNEEVKELFNNFATLRYYQIKYGDRGGNIVSVYNSNVCPGSVGQLFSKFPDPGVYLNFKVNSVTHRIDVSPPSSGTAITEVSFDSGRIEPAGAGRFGPVIDTELMYNTSYSDILKIQKAFVKETSSSTGL